MKKLFTIMTSLLALTLLMPASAQIADGVYRGNGNQSDLEIKTMNGSQRFTMNVLGANGHMCLDVEGSIEGLKGFVDESDSGTQQCELNLTTQGHIVNVDVSSYETCAQHCGMRASLAGSYRIVPETCTTKSITAQRNAFKKLYDQKSYQEAENILNKALVQCDFYLDFHVRDSVRNDLALALYHQKQPLLCREVLSQTVAMDKYVSLPLLESEMYEKLEKAIQYNWALCEDKSVPQQ